MIPFSLISACLFTMLISIMYSTHYLVYCLLSYLFKVYYYYSIVFNMQHTYCAPNPAPPPPFPSFRDL